jgi:dipeptidyl-peptidase 4
VRAFTVHSPSAMLQFMKTTFRSFVTIMLTAAIAPAADPATGKPLDTTFLKQFAETRGFTLGRPQKPKISPDGKTVLFLRADPKAPKLKLFEFDVATAQTKELLSPEALLKGADENLTPEEKARRERMRVSVCGFTDYHLDPDGKNILVMLSGKLYVFDRATGKATELKTGAGTIVDPKWSPDGKRIAYVRGFDVAVYDLASGKESMVTTGGTLVKTHGLAEFVAQEEMARFSGYWWSPDSKFIAYEEADHTGVETWYVADPFKPDQKPAEQYYPRPGKKNVAVKLGVMPVEGGETVWMKWPNKGEWEQAYEYLTQVVWDKYGPLTVQLETRKQDVVSTFSVDHRTGNTKWLLDIKAFDHWVNLKQLYLKWTKDGRLGATVGNSRSIAIDGNTPERERDFRLDGFSGQFDSLVHFDTDTLTTLYTSTFLPTDMHLFRAKGEPSGIQRRNASSITQGDGLFTAVSDGKLICLTKTTPQEMPATKVLAADGKVIGELPSIAVNPSFKPNVEFLPKHLTDGTTSSQVSHGDGLFSSAIVRPQNFDPKKKYPVVVDVYGGPGHVHVPMAMRNWLVPQWLADQGFIVVAIDNRGTPGRGDKWERAIYQKFGTVPIEDQVKGLHDLCDKYPQLDGDRVGIVGWSFGGYNAANGVLRRPDVFKAAVAGAPVTDWEDYDSHYTERYLGLLPESKAAYDEASLIPLAKDLKRPLMLVHGTADDNVYYRHTLKLSNALFRAGKEFEAVALPGVTHMYSADPAVMERLWVKNAEFFKKHLGEPK